MEIFTYVTENTFDSYLYQLVEHLNYALTQVDKQIVQTQVEINTGKAEAESGQQAIDNFNEIKGLIISSADIVNAYYEQINTRLEGIYVAQSDFGEYKQEVSTTYITASDASTMITEQTEEINGYVSELKGTIKAGILDNDEYGIEIGEQRTVGGVDTFQRFARFTAGKLEFFLGGNDPVAWMSDSKLYIKNAEITDSLKLGGYIVDVEDGLAFIWGGA